MEALARLAVAEEQRATAEAGPEITQLRSTLGLDADFQTWKGKAEGLMEAFYAHVPQWSRVPLKDRLRLVTMAVGELGPQTSYRRAALRAAELLKIELAAEERETKLAKARKRRPTAPPAAL